MRPRGSDFNTGRRKVQLVDITLPADRVEQSVARKFLLALQARHHGAVRGLLHAFHLFVQAQRDAMIAQVVGERLHHFGVGEFQQARPLFHQDHAHAQRREHAGVFDADDAAAHHDQRLRNLRHVQDLVAIDDVAPVDRHFGRCRRLGSGGDDDRFGAARSARRASSSTRTVCGSMKLAIAADQLDIVARQLRLDDVHFGLDHMLDAECQVGHRDLFFDAIVDAVDVLVVIAGKMEHGFAEGLAGNCAGVDTHPAHHFTALDQSDALAHLRALNGRALSGRARSR